MPRTARDLVDGGIYHILNRGNSRQRVFHKDADCYAFLALFSEMQESYGIELYAYCLMPNHFHLVVKIGRGEDLSLGMRWFTTTHVRRYHKHYQTSGHLWQGRYKSFLIDDDEHLLTMVRYVEGNPVRAELVETATGWVWSSHRERCGLEIGNKKGDCPSLFKGLSPEAENVQKGLSPAIRSPLLSPLPVPFNGDWTEFVDTPLTGKELGRVKKKIERQTKVRE